MNKKLALAVDKAIHLPEEMQETLACLMLEEMESERGWNERFDNSQDLLANLARRAQERIQRSEVYSGDPSDLSPP